MTNKDKWEFRYLACALAAAARERMTERLGRLRFWRDTEARIMEEVRTSGLEVTESLAPSVSNRPTHGPRLSVREDLQDKLNECYRKVREHDAAVRDYGGWVQVLEANPDDSLALTHDDWLYFFGRRYVDDSDETP